LVGVGVGVFRLVAAPFLAAADLAAALRPVPAGRRVLLPLDPFAPPRPDPLAAPRPPAEPPLRPLPPRPLVPAPLVPVPPLRPPDRLAEVPALDPALRPEPPPDAPPRPVLDRPVRPDEEREPEPVPRLAPLLPPPGGTLGRITSGDSSL